VKAVLWFPCPTIAGTNCQWEPVADEISVDQCNTNANPMHKRDCELSKKVSHSRALKELTVCILKCRKAIASKFNGLLQEHRGKGVHGDVKPETDQSKDGKQDSDRREGHKEWNCSNSALYTESVLE
jgi:hypothetical protein